MIWLLTALVVVAATAFHFWRHNTKDFYNLPGPSFKWYSPLLGNLVDVENCRDTLVSPDWIKMGWTGRYRFLFGTERMYTMDPGAIGHILGKADEWVKTNDFKTIMRRVTGEGLVTVEGAQHRRQRRVLSPAFSTSALASMGPVLWAKAAELVVLFQTLITDDSLEDLAARPAAPEDRVPGARKIDVIRHMNSFSADVIGLCGFGHDFGSLSRRGPSDPLAADFAQLVDACAEDALVTEAQNQFPILDLIPTRARRIVTRCKKSVDQISARFVARKRAEIHGLGLGAGTGAGMEGEGEGDAAAAALLAAEADDEGGGSDILSRLLAANARESGKASLTDDEVRDQIATMLFAGSSTAAVALAAVLWRLAEDQRVQDKLRAELAELADAPDMAVLDAAPYLDCVVRESLRLDSPVTCTVREAGRDTVLPLDVPVKGRDGRVMSEVAVKKGTYVLLSFSGMHTAPELWGEDAAQFRPERFEEDGWPRMPIPGIVRK